MKRRGHKLVDISLSKDKIARIAVERPKRNTRQNDTRMRKKSPIPKGNEKEVSYLLKHLRKDLNNSIQKTVNMKCDLCNEPNVGPEHEITEKHIRNRILFEYSKNRKHFAGNRKGILVSCNVQSSFSNLADCVDGKIKISAKPNEEVKFNFLIKNDCNREDVVVIFIQMLNCKLNFDMNDNSMGFGSKPVTMKPKATIKREVSFKCADIGQYELPIIFSFRKPGTKESLVIIRDMVVFVEEQQKVHKKEISPYTQQEVKADLLLQSSMADHNNDVFRIPKNYMGIYASGLKVKEDSSKEEKGFLEEISEVFKTGVTKENYVKFFHNLLWYEETIVRINLKKYNMSGVTLQQVGVGAKGFIYSLLVPGLSEKRPSLMLGDALFVKPHGNDEVMFKGRISDINENTAHIKDLEHTFERYYRFDAQFDIRFFPSRMPLERMHQAVNDVSNSVPEMSRVFPTENQRVKVVERIENFYNPLVEQNMEQRTGVEHIVAGTSGVAPFLLHGPPGTGKTVTIVEAILQLVTKNPQNRIMVCTESNMAADHVATMLIKYSHMFPEEKFLLRANSKFRVWETLPECLIKYSNGSSRDNFEPVSINDFMSFNIVITTLSHSAKFAKQLRHKKLGRPITHLFIDEAAQASEPSCLIPTCGLLTTGGALVLAGDPLQLGPVVISHNARRIGLGLSLMERLKHTCALYSSERNDPDYVVMLRNNFRSDPDILDIPNDLFYNQQLRAQASQDELSSRDILGERTHSRAIVFHGVLSKEQRMGKSPSFFNSMELEIVQKYIKCLITTHKVLPEDIGVVTPYIRQVYKIKNWLQEQNFGPGKIEVGTVEAFQGKEKRVIIISTVRANANLLDHDAKFQLGFLVDDKRFNVALTRAKAKAIIIGNPLCLQKDAKWRAYIEKCRQFGTYFGYEAEANNDVIQKDLVDTIKPIMKELKIN